MKPPFKMLIETDLEQWRYDTFWTKEPETIEWIKSFKSNGLFFDIGANIGVYSLYCASLYPNKITIAIEPMLNNFIRLSQNIILNKFNNILPFYMAIANDSKNKFLEFSMNDKPGKSGGQIESKLLYKHIVPVLTMDELIFNIGCPQNVKIDVDGIEWKILQGWQKYCDAESILIEINNQKRNILNWKYQHGYEGRNRFNNLKNHSRYRREKEGGNTAENVIFTRRG